MTKKEKTKEIQSSAGSISSNKKKSEEKSIHEAAIPLDITVILDRSGSMESIRDDAIGSFNAFLKEKQEKHPTSRMSLVLFDDLYLITENGSPIGDLKPLNSSTYVPRGSTALLDAIGRTVQAIEEREHEDEELLIAVLTDGQENASIEYTLEQIKQIIGEKEEKGWDFVYLSSDPAAFTDAQRMGFVTSKTARFVKENIHQAYNEMDGMMSVKLEKVRAIKRMKDEETKKQDAMYQ